MAEPAEKLVVAKTPPDAAAQEETKPKRNFTIPIIFTLLVLLLVFMGGMSYFLNVLSKQIKDLKDRPVIVQEVPEPETESIGKELTPKELGVLYPLDGFLVNLAGSDGGPKFLQVQMELELEEAEAEGEIKTRIASIRDAIILLLSSRSYDELKNPNGVIKLRKDLVLTINNKLSKGKIREIYFTQFHFN